MDANGLTKDELIFAKRMLPHFVTGKTPAEAAQAVLDDDARLLAAVCTEGPQFGGGKIKRPFRVQGLRDELTRWIVAAHYQN